MNDNEQIEQERWLPVVGWEGIYSVSDHGRIRREKAAESTRPGRILRPTIVRGYCRVHLSNDGSGEQRVVHRLVLEAFNGQCPDGAVACHCNGNGKDNRICNLRWDTPESNYRDRDNHGATARGERSGNVKITEELVHEIRKAYAGGSTQDEIAKKYKLHQTNVSRIVLGKTWKHIKTLKSTQVGVCT